MIAEITIVDIVIVGHKATIVIAKLSEHPKLSVTTTVKLKVPVPVDTPDTAPAESRLPPVGNDPDPIAMVYGKLPPETLSAPEKELPR